MAKFKQNNVELRDNQKLIFDSAKGKFISYDGSEVFINTTLSGVTPTEDYHLVTKTYVDGSSIFGSEFYEEESLGESSTTSTSYQTKLTLTTGSLPAGKYRIGWGFGWSFGSTSYDFKAEVTVNDVTELLDLHQEPKDSGVDQLYHCGGFGYWSGSGVTTIKVIYCTENGGITAYIRDARLEIWRVS